MIPLNITGGFYESESLPISAQQCTNFYVNIPQTEGALTQGNLFGTAGLSQIITTGTVRNSNRGSHVKNGLPYFLNGEVLYRLDRAVDVNGVETYTLATLGTIAGTARASFADNGTELIVITGGRGWIIDETSGTPFIEITAAGFTANGLPEQVRFVDSYFLVTTDSKKFIRSNSNDGLTWNALNFYSAEADPDNIVSLTISKNQAYIVGSETIQEYRDNAGVFQPTGFTLNKGAFAPFGIVNTSDTFMFIGGGVNESPAIWSMVGNKAEKVSTTAIDAVLMRFSAEDIQSAFAWSYAQSGAYFVGFTFPLRTFVYDLITNKWHERKSNVTDARGLSAEIRWRMNSMVTAYNKILCADSVDGRIGILSPDVYTEYENRMIRVFASAPLANQGERVLVKKLEATMESGVSLNNVDPQLRLSVSSDGGKTWNNELSRGFGKVGEYFRRAIWYRLGRFPRYAVFKFEMSDDVKPVFIKLEGDFR